MLRFLQQALTTDHKSSSSVWSLPVAADLTYINAATGESDQDPFVRPPRLRPLDGNRQVLEPLS